MGDLKLDWQIYYDAAARCHALAADIRAADKPLHDVVKTSCAGMAGDANGCRQWGIKYDEVAQQTMQACTNLADALTNYGCVLSAMGYNYAVANKSNPMPERPTDSPLSQYTVTVASSVGDNGPGVHQKDGAGIAEFYDKLIDKIGEEFGKLPNGDEDKLSKASTAWGAFAENATIKGAADQLGSIIALFDGVTEKKNLELVLGNLTTLRDSASQVAVAAQNIATPVAEYHTSTTAARQTFESEINTLLVGAGIAVALGVVAAAFSFGGSLAVSGGAVLGLVANTINAIRTAYTATKLYRIVGLTAATATAAVVLTHFDEVPSDALITLSTSLVAIIGMRVLVDDVDGDPSNGGATPQTGEYTQADVDRVAEHLGKLDHFGANDEMIQRIRDKIAAGEALSEAQENFMKHELTEAGLMADGMSYEQAHEKALETHPPGKNYDPDVIDKYPEFGPWWRKQNGLPPR